MDQKTQEKPVDVTSNDRFAGIKNYFKKRPPKKRLLIIIAICVTLLVGGVAALVFFGPEAEEPAPVENIETTYVAPPEPVYSPLTGAEVASEELAKRPVTGVMIENSIDARPQSGLEEAGVVFEAIAEGGITRFLALYQEARPSNIGPIRSARPYYVEWAKGFDASYLHSGGSPEALSLIRSLGVNDLDHGNYSSRIADRVSNRFAPHNVYSNADKIDALNKDLGFTSSEFTAFARKEAEPATAEKPGDATKIDFNISGANYNTAYTYDANSNEYKRNMAGLPHKDQESGKQITPEVVVAMITTYGIHPNGIHSVYKTTGSGEALIFQDGSVTKATWKKATQSATLQFLDSSGEPVPLNPGQTWITAIQSGRTTYTP